MKRYVAASADSAKVYAKAEKILKASKELLDMMEDTPELFLQYNDLMDLYDELIETIPAFQMAVRSKTLQF